MITISPLMMIFLYSGILSAISIAIKVAIDEIITKDGFGVDDKEFAKIIAKRVA